MKGTIQFIQLSPEEFQEAILKGVKAEIDSLKREFQPQEPTEYMTREDVRDMLNIDLSTVHNWTKRGKLKSYGIGNRVYFKRKEVQQAIKPLNHKQ
jgi:excisionase family DNA binding protein